MTPPGRRPPSPLSRSSPSPPPPSPAPAPVLCILEVLESSAGYLTRHGVDQARLNAEHLLAHVLGKKRLDLYLEFDRPVGPAELAPMRDLIRRRGQGVPLQHLLGTAEFHGRSFRCDERALVPRPETEQLVELALKRVPTDGGEHDLLDLGTGSGVIALTLAAARPAARVVAVDLSADALALARENATALGLAERVEWLLGDLFAPVDPARRFDAVVANLPYVNRDEIPRLAREVRRDPHAALDGGRDGLAVIGRAVAETTRRLRPAGFLALEIGHDQAARVVALLESANYRDIQVEKDYQGTERFVFAAYGVG